MIGFALWVLENFRRAIGKVEAFIWERKIGRDFTQEVRERRGREREREKTKEGAIF